MDKALKKDIGQMLCPNVQVYYLNNSSTWLLKINPPIKSKIEDISNTIPAALINALLVNIRYSPPIIKSIAIIKYGIQLFAYICFNLNAVISLNIPLYASHKPKIILINANIVLEKINVKIPASIKAIPDALSKFFNENCLFILYAVTILEIPTNNSIPAPVYVIIFATSAGLVINIIDNPIKHNEIKIDSFPVFLISFSICFTSGKIIHQLKCLSRYNY